MPKNDIVRAPILYDSMDRPNAPPTYKNTDNGREKERRFGLPPQFMAYIMAFGVISLLFFVIYVVVMLSNVSAGTGYEAAFARLLLWVLWVAPVIGFTTVIIGFTFYAVVYFRNNAFMARMLSLNDGPHYDAFSTKNVDLTRIFESLAHRHYDVLEESARQGQYRGIQTLTLDKSVEYSPDLSRQDTRIPGSEPQQPMLPPPPAFKVLEDTDSRPKLEILRDKGLICRSGNSLTVGFDDEEKPVTFDLFTSGAHALVGRPHSGKTSTVRFLAAQIAMLGGKIAIIDPHGNAGKDSLLQSLQSLKGSFYTDAAIRPKEALEVIRSIFDLGRERVQTADRSNDFPVVLLIDEFTAMMDGADPMWEEVKREITACLGSMSRQFRKVNMTSIIIGHSWKANLAGGTELRSNIGTKILHTTSANEAKFFELPKELEKRLDKLQTGTSFVYYNGDARYVSRIPYLREEDISAALHLMPTIRTAVETEEQRAAYLATLLEGDYGFTEKEKRA